MKHFQINNLKSFFRRDRNKNGGDIIFYINENIPCKIVNVEGLADDLQVKSL